MELFTDIRSRLPFRAGGTREADPSAKKWESLVAAEEFLVADIDRSGMIQVASESLCRLRGAEGADLVGTSLLYLVNAEDRTSFSDLVRGVFEGGEAGAGQARLLTAGEQTPLVRWFVFPIQGPGGEIEKACCLGADLSACFEGGFPGTSGAELETLRQQVAGLERDNVVLRTELDHRVVSPPEASEGTGHSSELVEGQIPGLEEGGSAPTLAELERRYIVQTLEDTGGRVSGAKGAAAILGLHPNTLRSRMAKLGIERRG